MSGFTDMETPSFPEDLRKILILSFKSYRKSLLYAGYKEEVFSNWTLAADFAKANNMSPIQATEGGKYLSIPDRLADLQYSRDQFIKVWDRASVKYCLNIEGSVKTFVCGANENSTFRRKEIHALLRSTAVDDINGRNHEEYVTLRRAVLARLNEEGQVPQNQRHMRAINRVFRALAIAEIRQDLALAHEQNNEPEAQSILARIFHLKTQHRDELRRMPRPYEEQQLAKTMQTAEEMSYANPDLHIPLFIPRHAHG